MPSYSKLLGEPSWTTLIASMIFHLAGDESVLQNWGDMLTPVEYCPVDLREKTVQVRYDRMRRDQFVVYFDGSRMGDANVLDLHANARARQPDAEVRHD